MDKIFFLTMLYDFYSELLTNKQKEIFELYYLNDFSLHEIGSMYKISRQAVLDTIKRTEKVLSNYEQKLSLVEKYFKQKKSIENIINNIENIISDNSSNYIDTLEVVKKDLSNLLD